MPEPNMKIVNPAQSTESPITASTRQSADPSAAAATVAAPADPLSQAMTWLRKVQTLLAEPDTDGLRSSLIEPILKRTISNLNEVLEQHKTRRRRKD